MKTTVKIPCPDCGCEMSVINECPRDVICPSCEKSWWVARTLLLQETDDESKRRYGVLQELWRDHD